ncbi:MAG: DsbA family protein [Pseudomonadota bacterium]
MTEKPRVYHAFRSPYSRLGLHKTARAGLDVDLIPFTGPPDGVEFHDPVRNKAKLAYYGFDAPRMAARMGLEIAFPNPFAVDFNAANRAQVCASRAGRGLSFAIAVADARWERGENVSDLDVLRAAARAAGLDEDIVDAAQTDGTVADEMAAHRTLIEKDMVFGVPFAVFGSAKYWGHERFDLLAEDVAAAKA